MTMTRSVFAFTFHFGKWKVSVRVKSQKLHRRFLNASPLVQAAAGVARCCEKSTREFVENTNRGGKKKTPPIIIHPNEMQRQIRLILKRMHRGAQSI